MLELLKNISVDANSLLAATSLPLLYFVFLKTHFHRPKTVRVVSILLRIVVISFALFVVAKFSMALKGITLDTSKLYILHLIPLTLTFLHSSIFCGGNFGASKAKKTSTKQLRKQQKASIEHLTWDHVVMDHELKEELRSIAKLLADSKTANRYGIQAPKGILLSGPPGTGKTTIARAMAHEADLSFFALPLDSIFSKYVGESEKNLSHIFHLAAQNAPSVIFIDEVDAIGRQRSGGERWAENLLNHLLQLIDGVAASEGIYVIAATNRPELVDDALKRAGRLTKEVHIPLPDFNSRCQLFQLYLSRLQLASGISIENLARITDGKSAADIKEICNQAGLNAFKRESDGHKRSYVVATRDLEQALREFTRQAA